MTAQDVTVTVATNRPAVAVGERLEIRITVTNNSSRPVSLGFSSGCATDYEFLTETGAVAATSEQMCTQQMTERTLAPGGAFSDVHIWVRGMAGAPDLAAGSYGVRGVLLTSGDRPRSGVVPLRVP